MMAQPAERLVIRVKFAREEPQQAPARPGLNLRVLLLILVPVAVALTWLGISLFKSHPAAERPAKVADVVAPQKAKVEPAPAETPSSPATEPSAVNQEIPKVSPGARETIRGTIKVSVRMIVDREGKVVAATLDESGPSRYFSRLALEASKKWTFASTDSKQQRIAVVKFNFSRDATTAHLTSLSTSG